MFRTPFNYDTDAVSLETGFSSDEPSLTQQHMRDETDINVMVSRFARGLEIPMPSFSPEDFVFDEVFDFQTAMNQVVAAREAFDEMPLAIRKRFNHDAAEMVAFLQNPENVYEAEKLGLLTVKQPDSIPSNDTPPDTPAE